MKRAGQITRVFFIGLISLLVTVCDLASAWVSDYNVVWDSQSKNAMESMPCGGHDIGLNIWVENGNVLFYMQRSGSLAETNEYLKLGRVRLQLDPNPFISPSGQFRQELKLHQGYVEIYGKLVEGSGKELEDIIRQCPSQWTI